VHQIAEAQSIKPYRRFGVFAGGHFRFKSGGDLKQNIKTHSRFAVAAEYYLADAALFGLFVNLFKHFFGGRLPALKVKIITVKHHGKLRLYTKDAGVRASVCKIYIKIILESVYYLGFIFHIIIIALFIRRAKPQ